MTTDLRRISVDPEVMGGVPCIRDTRVTVSMVLGQLAGGQTWREVLAAYPYLDVQDVSAALGYAAEVTNRAPTGLGPCEFPDCPHDATRLFRGCVALCDIRHEGDVERSSE